MRRLRLLFLTRFPLEAPLIGASIRNWHFIQSLGKHHDLTVLSFAYDVRVQQIERLYGQFCEAIIFVRNHWQLREPLTGLPDLVGQLAARSLLDALEWLDTATYDGVIIDTIYMTAFQPYLRTPAILFEHNIESELLQQIGTTEAAAELARYETAVWSVCPLRTVVSQHDREIMASRVPGKILVVPNGSDPKLWIPQLQHQSHQLLFAGTLYYEPNVQGICNFVEQMWELIHSRQPQLKLVIAGRDPVPSVRQLERYPGVEVLANPIRMREVAKDCSISIVPLSQGSGTRLKILEALAMGMPVVSTAIGCEGLDLADGEHLLIRDDPAAFVEAILEVDRNANLWQRLRDRGRERFLETYTWEQCYRPLDLELRTLL
jgi:glycosyltransferase involved in cell wall biosynthesis